MQESVGSPGGRGRGVRLEGLINGRQFEGPEGMDEVKKKKAYSEAEGSGWAGKVGGEDQKK